MLDNLLKYDENDKNSKSIKCNINAQDFECYNARQVLFEIDKKKKEKVMNDFNLGNLLSKYTENFPDDL
jgi:hypothetical protein